MRALRSALPITHLTPHCTLTRHLADYNSFLSPAAPPPASCCFPFGVFSFSPAAPSSSSCCFPLSESLFSVLPLPLLRRAASLSLSHAAAWVGDPIFITSTSEHDVCARGRMPRLREVSRLRLRDAARLEGEGGQASHPAIGHRARGGGPATPGRAGPYSAPRPPGAGQDTPLRPRGRSVPRSRCAISCASQAWPRERGGAGRGSDPSRGGFLGLRLGAAHLDLGTCSVCARLRRSRLAGLRRLRQTDLASRSQLPIRGVRIGGLGRASGVGGHLRR